MTGIDPLRRLPDDVDPADLAQNARLEHIQRVLIIGAGPAGLACALSLVQLGVPVTVMEKGATLASESRASTLHPPTLELLSDMGVIEPVLRAGLRAPSTQFRDRHAGPVAVFDMGVLADETSFPFRIQLEQNKLTDMMRDRLLEGKAAGEYDVEIVMEYRGHAVNTDGESAAVLVGTQEGFVQIAAPWVVAADGAHSPLRDSLGIALLGEQYPEEFLVVTVADDLMQLMPDLSSVNYVADPDEWLVLLQTPDHWRVLFPVVADDEREHVFDPDSLQQRLQSVVNNPVPWTVVAASIYVVRRAVAETMVMGRVLLVGDSAHQNSPLGGMGMNSGIQDGVSCARRLADVWHGRTSSETLNEYDRRRRAIATGYVQADSHANYIALRERDEDLRMQLQQELRDIVADPARLRERMRRTAMIDAVKNSL
jgi:2-polyprenyl-6-methoxyphenol hydroxylase-like FAD-dependent oxidoreductase